MAVTMSIFTLQHRHPCTISQAQHTIVVRQSCCCCADPVEGVYYTAQYTEEIPTSVPLLRYGRRFCN